MILLVAFLLIVAVIGGYCIGLGIEGIVDELGPAEVIRRIRGY